jgi:hypothetical protein
MWGKLLLEVVIVYEREWLLGWASGAPEFGALGLDSRPSRPTRKAVKGLSLKWQSHNFSFMLLEGLMSILVKLEWRNL